MKRLYATVDPAEAQELRTLLRDQGIESAVGHDDDSVAFGGTPHKVSITINVRDEDAPAAAEALARHFEQRDTEEPDSEAPVPLTPDESAAFEAKVKENSRRWRFWEFLIHGPLGIAAWIVTGFLRLLDVIAGNKTDPPPDAGSGSADKSSGST